MRPDTELNALFAEHIADHKSPGGRYWHERDESHMDTPYHYTDDANAVLPWLEKYDALIDCASTEIEPREQWFVAVYHENGMSEGEAPTFPRAAVIALLRAKSIDV